jgi:FtsP/CotA-like multicopper oxidase with cupredoxin domain
MRQIRQVIVMFSMRIILLKEKVPMQKRICLRLFQTGVLLTLLQIGYAVELQSPPTVSSNTPELRLSIDMKRCGNDLTPNDPCRTSLANIGPATGSNLNDANVRGFYRYKVIRHGQSSRHYDAMPKTIKLRQNQSLRFELNNQVPCPAPERELEAHINIHTHGLLVSPREADPPRTDSFGDYSGVTITNTKCSNHSGTGHSKGHTVAHDSAALRQGSARYEIQIPKDHPSGLYWYHPHIHGVAGFQIGGGASGLIEIGELFDYAYFNCSLKAHPGSGRVKCKTTAEITKEVAQQKGVDQVLIALKDYQIAKAPDRQNEWIFPAGYAGENKTKWFAADLCAQTLNVDGKDQAWPNAQCQDPSNSKSWVFTLNNQVFPTITIPVKDGVVGGKVLRIANVSANVTHKLRLRVLLPDGVWANLNYKLLARDGLSIGTNKEVQSLETTSIAMMPASRVEIFVSHDNVCEAMKAGNGCAHGPIEGRLESEGMSTGTPEAPADQWPNIELAKLIFPATSKRNVDDGQRLKVAVNRFEDEPQQNVLTFKSQPTRSRGVPMNSPYTCDGTLTKPEVLKSGQYRLIGFNVIDEGKNTNPFQLASQVFGKDSNPKTASIDQKQYAAFDPSVKKPSVCVGTPLKDGGVEETWVIVNESKELHNFHIHQVKFKVEEIWDASSSEAQPISLKAGGFHDTFPINPGGRIKIKINFNRPEQLGRYFFHCHILEHEDKGMMARIQVIDTSDRSVRSDPMSYAKSLKTASVSGKSLTVEQPLDSGFQKVLAPVGLLERPASSNRIVTFKDRFGREIAQDICTAPK